jgi:hypothetical protein
MLLICFDDFQLISFAQIKAALPADVFAFEHMLPSFASLLDVPQDPTGTLLHSLSDGFHFSVQGGIDLD